MITKNLKRSQHYVRMCGLQSSIGKRGNQLQREFIGALYFDAALLAVELELASRSHDERNECVDILVREFPDLQTDLEIHRYFLILERVGEMLSTLGKDAFVFRGSFLKGMLVCLAEFDHGVHIEVLRMEKELPKAEKPSANTVRAFRRTCDTIADELESGAPDDESDSNQGSGKGQNDEADDDSPDDKPNERDELGELGRILKDMVPDLDLAIRSLDPLFRRCKREKLAERVQKLSLEDRQKLVNQVGERVGALATSINQLLILGKRRRLL